MPSCQPLVPSLPSHLQALHPRVPMHQLLTSLHPTDSPRLQMEHRPTLEDEKLPAQYTALRCKPHLPTAPKNRSVKLGLGVRARSEGQRHSAMSFSRATGCCRAASSFQSGSKFPLPKWNVRRSKASRNLATLGACGAQRCLKAISMRSSADGEAMATSLPNAEASKMPLKVHPLANPRSLEVLRRLRGQHAIKTSPSRRECGRAAWGE